MPASLMLLMQLPRYEQKDSVGLVADKSLWSTMEFGLGGRILPVWIGTVPLERVGN